LKCTMSSFVHPHAVSPWSIDLARLPQQMPL